MSQSLPQILISIDWLKSVGEFAKNKKHVSAIERGCRLVAIWNQELSFYDSINPATPFLQEMKASLFYVPACTALGLTKPAASSLRAAVESALYYTYFRDHPKELETLRKNKKFYITRSKIIDYHNLHTPEFQKKQTALGLVGELNEWYGRVSAIVHGQIPGVWTSHSLEDTEYSEKECAAFIKEFELAVKIINRLFISTLDQAAWEGLSSQARQIFLKGLTKPTKLALGLSII